MKNIFWLDLEMTGLNPEQDVILELAAIVTRKNLQILDRYEAVVFQPPAALAGMDAWCQKTHGESGLMERVPNGKPLEIVEQEVIEFLGPYFPDEAPVLAGNSIHQDRRFINRYMKNLAAKLHYRMIDVSSFKQIYKNLYGISFPKNNNHRALGDIEASIAELQHYLGFIRLEPELTSG